MERFESENLKKEWKDILKYYSNKSEEERFLSFKQIYDNFEGDVIDEFNQMNAVAYKEWNYWKRSIYRKVDLEIFSEVWNEFKKYWQYDTEETKKVLKEMELLSDNMLDEWRFKYTFRFQYVYEEDVYWKMNSDHLKNMLKKPKAQLWEEFKEKWDIDIENYDENMYNKMSAFVSECLSDDDTNYFKDYPRNFYEFRENANFHSYYGYSLLEKYEIANDWADHRNGPRSFS